MTQAADCRLETRPAGLLLRLSHLSKRSPPTAQGRGRRGARERSGELQLREGPTAAARRRRAVRRPRAASLPALESNALRGAQVGARASPALPARAAAGAEAGAAAAAAARPAAAASAAPARSPERRAA